MRWCAFVTLDCATPIGRQRHPNWWTAENRKAKWKLPGLLCSESDGSSSYLEEDKEAPQRDHESGGFASCDFSASSDHGQADNQQDYDPDAEDIERGKQRSQRRRSIVRQEESEVCGGETGRVEEITIRKNLEITHHQRGHR